MKIYPSVGDGQDAMLAHVFLACVSPRAQVMDGRLGQPREGAGEAA
jgi:hypothetical protein